MNPVMDPLKTGAISMPGAHQLTLTGIRWAGQPTDKEFAAADRLAQTIDRIYAWVDGDLSAEYVRREQYKRPGMTVQTLLHEYALARTKQVDAVKHRYGVSNFFKHEHRSSISWSHHFVLWGAGLDLRQALAWIKKCEQHNWRVEELRAQLKRELRPATLPEPEIHGLFPVELQEAVDWVSGRLDEVDTMPIAAVQAILRDAHPLVEFVDRLRARAATPTKESIQSAA